MNFELFIAFFLASSFMIFIPGPTAIIITHYALQYGKWAGRFSIPAVILGDIAALTFAFAGLGAFLKLFPEWFFILKIAGGIYLIILGIVEFYSNTTIKEDNTPPTKPRGRSVFMHVFLITAFNPKSIIFFLAFFPLFIDPTLNTTKQLLIMGFIFVALGAISAIIYDLAAAKISAWVRKKSNSRIIHIITSLILCILGLTTIFI